MLTKSIFRTIVLLSTISYMLWFFYPSMGLFLPDAQTAKLVSLSGYGAKIAIVPAVYWSFFVLFIIASIGLLLFNNWARNLFVTLLIVSYVLSVFSGVSINSAMGAFFSNLSTLLDGAILVSMFSPQLAPFFNKEYSN